MNESMATNYPKTLTPQTGKDKTLQTRVGVVRKTTLKPNKNDPDEPDIDTENIPVVQGSFQITKTEADITENKQNSSPARHDDKVGHKVSPSKSTTTTKAPTTKTTTTKRVPTNTPKTRPFTIKSTFNIKTKTDSATKTEIDITTIKSVTSTITNPSNTTTSTTMTPKFTTTSNVSQILFDLLTNENHYKDLPKIDSLFTVPHVIDNEPWRPITQPYYETSNKPTTPSSTIPDITELNAEDRMGIAEVVDDVSILESMLTPIPPVNREKTTRSPIPLRKEPYLGSNVYPNHPVYTSFTMPSYVSSVKNMETLGSNYPKPFPIPVDKISSVVEIPVYTDDEDDGMPMQRPPKDTKTSAVINVLEMDKHEDDTEQVSIDGASIVKKQNTSTTSSSTSTTTTSSTTTTTTVKSITTSTSTSTKPVEMNRNSTEDLKVQQQSSNIPSHTTRRPNNKVSIIPSTSPIHHTWELVNTSTNDKNDTLSKNSPEKYYNDTLQAIITRNDALLPNTTTKFPSKSSVMRNLTDIIKKYSQKPQEKVEKIKDENIEIEERHGLSKGTVEVVLDEEQDATTVRSIITLLPAKSNLGVNRPLRPRPKIKPEAESSEENVRSFFHDDQEAEKLISNLSTENNVPLNNEEEGVSDSANEKSPTALRDDIEDYSAAATNNMKVYDFTNSASSGIRYPKSNDDAIKTDKLPNVPDGTYRVSYHVTGSVSSKQANKTQTLPAYELALEPDIVLEIPINQSNTLTIDKLRQLASLATVSDSSNNTFFRTPGGGVISTKAIPSSYTLNQAGFKILTKTYNKAQSIKQENNENSLDKPEKIYSKPNKPQKEKENVTIEEHIPEGK